MAKQYLGNVCSQLLARCAGGAQSHDFGTAVIVCSPERQNFHRAGVLERTLFLCKGEINLH